MSSLPDVFISTFSFFLQRKISPAYLFMEIVNHFAKSFVAFFTLKGQMRIYIDVHAQKKIFSQHTEHSSFPTVLSGSTTATFTRKLDDSF